MEDQLVDLGYVVNRISGGNRYITALEVAENMFEVPDTVIVASGENFPDALAGGPLAAKLDAPVLLVEKDEIRDEVLDYLKANGVVNVIVLGGEIVISDHVVREIENVIK